MRGTLNERDLLEDTATDSAAIHTAVPGVLSWDELLEEVREERLRGSSLIKEQSTWCEVHVVCVPRLRTIKE